jgi:methylthioribose-1-phosphate isomerase
MAPEGIAVRNPAFDVTPARLVSAIITERGVVQGDYLQGLKELLGNK